MDLVGVFLPNCPYKNAEPEFRISREYARELRNYGLGDFINRAKGFRLNFVPQLKARGSSCSVGERVANGYVDAETWAQRIIESWFSNHKRRSDDAFGMPEAQSNSAGRIAVLPGAVTRRVFTVSACD